MGFEQVTNSIFLQNMYLHIHMVAEDNVWKKIYWNIYSDYPKMVGF